ncbi:MAG: hypothetical protein IVW56_08695 [Candidatus Binataceae bacterium]|nr:hypothetical protein [Candidatus Binataceae bacterium]
MPVEIRSARGLYRLAEAAPPEDSPDSLMLTLALERADGVERVVLRCRIAAAFIPNETDATELLARLKPWFEREFEQTREAALKSIRSERRLHEIVFDRAHPGPF